MQRDARLSLSDKGAKEALAIGFWHSAEAGKGCQHFLGLGPARLWPDVLFNEQVPATEDLVIPCAGELRDSIFGS